MFPIIKTIDQTIIHFLGEMISDQHIFGKRILSLSKGLTKKKVHEFKSELNSIINQIMSDINDHVLYNNMFKINVDKLTQMILDLKKEKLKFSLET